uniref:glycoside hydrolase family 26 protein n=1 Tax=uncultured Dysgonomonas sp. TaxID=206096 RepID=UPI0026087614|nr:glycosyl hydrolase [uncultured Dysgonomonas sp.]
MMHKTIAFTFCFLWLSVAYASDFLLVDPVATAETKALFYNLKKIEQSDRVIFGQQDATLYGRSWVGDSNRSDVKDLCGQHPALIGFDFEAATESDPVKFENIKNRLVKATKEVYRQGGIITFSWHSKNPANDGSFYWEKNPVESVKDILPEGKLHAKYKQYLESIAKVINDCKGDNGELIPIIFRPFHEFDGDWFWWGKGHCSKDEFIALWQFTVTYLRDNMEVHNLLYAFSPDCKFFTEEEFMEYYPGDKYVDIIGMDNYWDFRPDGANDPQLAAQKLKIVSDIATKKNKIAALTETGLEGVSNPLWYTQVLLSVLQSTKVAYVMVWRNASDLPTHYYTPTVGHSAAQDFIRFSEDKNILFQSDLPDMYKSSYKLQDSGVIRGSGSALPVIKQ